MLSSDETCVDAVFRNVYNLPKNWKSDSILVKKNSNGNVIRILLFDLGLNGSVDLTKLPPNLKELSLDSNKLAGHLDLTKLPSSLEELFLSDNSFTTISISALPKPFARFDISGNKLRGVILEPVLKPSFVEEFDASHNDDLVVCETQEEYDKVIAEMTGCVRMLRAARSSTHNAHEAFKLWSVAQQTVNFLVSDVCLE